MPMKYGIDRHPADKKKTAAVRRCITAAVKIAGWLSALPPVIYFKSLIAARHIRARSFLASADDKPSLRSRSKNKPSAALTPT